jgi:hypothetical protein
MFEDQFGGAYVPNQPDLLFYKANLRRQKGYGLGGLFGTIAKYVLPFAKRFILPHAKRAVRDIALDVTDSNIPFKESLKRRGIGALKAIGKDVLEQKGSGKKRKIQKKKPKTKTRKSSKLSKKSATKSIKRKTTKNSKLNKKAQKRKQKSVKIKSIFD